MSDVPPRRVFKFSPPAISPNSEKIPVQAATSQVPASIWLDEQYSYIGGRHGGSVVKCLSAGNREIVQAATRQHALNRALIAICWHLAKKVVDDDLEYQIIADLPRWNERHIKPKIKDDIAARCRFMAILMFSDQSGQNDNGATKKGRIVSYLIKSGVGEDIVVKYLSRTGGVGRVYEEALANGSVTGDGCAPSETSARSRRTTPTRKITSSSVRSELVSSDPAQALKRLVACVSDHADMEASIILADVNEHAIFAEMNPGDELQLTAKRVDRGGDCFVFRVSETRLADAGE